MIDPAAQFKPTRTKLKAYGDTSIHPLGEITAQIKINGKRKEAEFIAVEDAAASIADLRTAIGGSEVDNCN